MVQQIGLVLQVTSCCTRKSLDFNLVALVSFVLVTLSKWWMSHSGTQLLIWSQGFMRRSLLLIEFPALCQIVCHANSQRVMTPGCQVTGLAYALL